MKNLQNSRETYGFTMWHEDARDWGEEIFADEPRKIITERVEILALTQKEWAEMLRRLGIAVTNLYDAQNYRDIIEAANALCDDEICGVFDLAQWLGFGEYRHIDEDFPAFVDEFDEFPYIVWSGEAASDCGAGWNFLDSEFYAVQQWNGSNWVFAYGDDYEEVKK